MHCLEGKCSRSIGCVLPERHAKGACVLPEGHMPEEAAALKMLAVLCLL